VQERECVCVVMCVCGVCVCVSGYVCVCGVCASYVINSRRRRRRYNIGKSCVTVGLNSWRTSREFNTKFPY